jgi:hypothetical protein
MQVNDPPLPIQVLIWAQSAVAVAGVTTVSADAATTADEDNRSALARVKIDTTLSLERYRSVTIGDAPLSPSPRAFSETEVFMGHTPGVRRGGARQVPAKLP